MSSRALACVLTLLAASALRAAPLAKAPSSLSSSSSSSSPSAAAALGHVEAPACSGTNVQLGAMSAGELFYIPCATSAMAGGGVWVHDVNVSNAQGAVLGVFNTDGPDCVNLESSYSSYSTSTSSAPAIVFTGAPCQNAPACCTVVRCNAVNGARGCPGVAASFAFYRPSSGGAGLLSAAAVVALATVLPLCCCFCVIGCACRAHRLGRLRRDGGLGQQQALVEYAVVQPQAPMAVYIAQPPPPPQQQQQQQYQQQWAPAQQQWAPAQQWQQPGQHFAQQPQWAPMAPLAPTPQQQHPQWAPSQQQQYPAYAPPPAHFPTAPPQFASAPPASSTYK